LAVKTSADLALIGIAKPQFGAFSREQARNAGHSARTIGYRVDSGRWEVMHTGVYALAGTHPSWERDQMAACLWSKGVSAGRAAGHLHQLPGCDGPPIEVVTTHHHRPMPRCGIKVHYTTWLPAEQIGRIHNIPATSIERTLLDLCGQMAPRRAAIALDNALHRGLTTLGAIDNCLYLTARRGRNGCRVLRNLMLERVGLGETPNTPLETVIFEMIAGSLLPLPEAQVPVFDENGVVVARPDFLYRRERLIIEGHSKMWHWGMQAESRDLERHNKLCALGYRTLYLTWADATTYSARSLTTIGNLLNRASSETNS
jgi:hypothetical protein